MKHHSSRKKFFGIPLIKKTLNSYSTRERWLSIALALVFVLSGWKAVTGNWQGRGLFSVVQGGHNYNEGLVGEITRLNPVYADLNEVDRDITSLIFEGLTKYDPKQKAVVENIAAHTLDGSKTLYTFTLNEGLKWHDNEPVTADDLYFTFHDVIQHPEFENLVLKSSFEGVTVEKVDDRTVTMKLNEPNAFFFTQLTVGILPQHLLKDVPVNELDTDEFNQNPVGNGPYKVKGAYEKNRDGSTEVELEYDKNYWRKVNPDITTINFRTFPTHEALRKARGQLHGIPRVQAYRAQDLNEDRLVEYEYSLPQYTALFIQTDDEVLRARNVRLGIQKAIDKDKILEAIGYDQRIDTPLLELEQDDWIHQPNPEEAQGALFDAGWKLDTATGKRTNEEGKTLALVLIRRSYPNNEKQEEITRITAELILQQLEAVGIQVTVESYEDQTFQEKVQKRDYDLLLYGQSLGYNLDTYSYWHSSQGTKGLNLSNYGNAKADFNIEAIRNLFGDQEEKRSEHLQKLAQTIKEDIPAVFLYAPSYTFLVDDRIQNLYIENLLFPHDRFANILEWKVL